MSFTDSQRMDIDSVLHPYTNLELHEKVGPLVIAKGDGIHVHDEQGNQYIDAISGLFCSPLGFSEHRLADAAYAQMRELPYYHGFGHKSSAPSIKLADRLLKMAPVPMSKVFFANSGSEANDTAIKTIWYHFNAQGKPEKKKIISRQRAYHGVTIASGSLTGLPYAHREFDLPIDRILHTDCPSFYHHGLPGETEEEFASRLAESLEQLILREGPDTIAAFFAEPLLASGGVIIPPKTYYEKVQKILKKYGILLVADEVICGFGRTGNMFGSQTFGMEPDMITVAKQLSNGYQPISALMVSESIYQSLVDQSRKLKAFGHGFTYTGHPVAAAVALETLDIFDEMDVVSRVRELEPEFSAGMKQLGEHPLVGEVRCCGLLGGLEITKDKATRTGFAPELGVGGMITQFAQQEGVITRCLNDTLTFCPPYIITKDEMQLMFERTLKALNATYVWAMDQGFLD